MSPLPALQAQWDAAQQGAGGWVILAIAVAVGLMLIEWANKEPPHRGPWGK